MSRLAEIHAHLRSTRNDVKTSDQVYRSDSPAVEVMRHHLQATLSGLIALTEEVQRLTPEPEGEPQSAPASVDVDLLLEVVGAIRKKDAEFQTQFNRDMPRPK